MATEMNKTYNPSEIEDRLYKKWMDKKFAARNHLQL